MEGDGDFGTSSASTSSAEPDVRCDKLDSSSSGERKRRSGSTAVIIEAEGPLIFSERSGEPGNSGCGGVLAGEDKAFMSEKLWWSSASSSLSSSPSSSPPDCSSGGAKNLY